MPILHISIAYIDITDTEIRKREILCCFSEKKTAEVSFLLSCFCVMKKSKRNFAFLVLLRDQKYQKSSKRAFPSLCKLFPRARVSRASRAWQVHAANGKAKVDSLTLSAISYYHACEHITRKSRADSCTHCLHARIYRCGGRGSDMRADESKDFRQPSPVGEGGPR